MKKIIYLILLGFITFSCSTGDNNVIFDPVNGQTLINFASANADLPILINGTGSVDIEVQATTISEVDRTFNVLEIPLDDPDLAADPANFTVAQAIIPANSFIGTLTVQGQDITAEVDARFIDLQFVEENDIVTDNPLRLSVFQVCPVEPTAFTGMYQVSGPSAVSGGSDLIGTDVLVEIIATSDTGREFEANYLADLGIGQPNFTFAFGLVCDQVIPGPPVATNLICGTGQPPITLGPPPVEMRSPYDANDDSIFEITLVEDVDDSCGDGDVDVVTIQLVKQ